MCNRQMSKKHKLEYKFMDSKDADVIRRTNIMEFIKIIDPEGHGTTRPSAGTVIEAYKNNKIDYDFAINSLWGMGLVEDKQMKEVNFMARIKNVYNYYRNKKNGTNK